MHVGWPQGIFIAWVALALLANAVNDGEPLKPPHDRYRFGVAAIRAGALVGLVYWGGFFA